MILTEAVIAHALAAIPELQVRIVRIRAAAHGTLVVIPLLLLLLLLLWYCQIQYRPFFPLTATLGLAGFTLLLSLLAFAMYRP